MWQWSATEAQWIPTADHPCGVSTAGLSSTLVVVTYNVWFAEHNLHIRSAALEKLMHQAEADIIALQEVTAPFLQFLLALDWVKDHFSISDATGSTLGSYGVLLLVRRSEALSVAAFSLHELDSLMDRQLLVAKLQVRHDGMSREILVGTVHLESLKSRSVREAQLRTIFPILHEAESAILCGDFNFGDGWPETAAIDKDYADAWLVAHPGDSGFTMPAFEQFEPWRPDRVLLRSSVYGVQNMKIIGNQDLPGEECDLMGVRTPSDHYGLVCTLAATL